LFHGPRRLLELDGPGLLASAIDDFKADGVLTRDNLSSALYQEQKSARRVD